MLTLGRLAALTASVEHSTEQRESERRLAERVELTRELHENAIQRLFGVALALGSERGLSAEERRRCQEELRSVVGDLRTALTRPVGATPRGHRDRPRRGAGAPASSAGRSCGSTGRRGSRSRPTSSRWPSRSSSRRCATPTATPQPSEIDVRVYLRRRDLHAWRSRTTAPATARRPAAAASACAWPRSKRCATRAWSSSAPAPGGRWRVRLVVPVAVLMATEERKLRVLVVDDHDVVQWGFRLLLERQSWVERCLAASNGAEAVDGLPPPAARGGPGRHAARQRVRGRGLRGDPRRQPAHPGAADLRRRGDLALRRPLRRRLRLHLQGLVRGRRGQGGADGLARHRGLRRPGRRSTRRSPSASRRCSR